MQLSTNCDYSTIFKQLPTIISGINQLGEATNKLKAINFSVVGLNTGNIDAYRNAISGISKEQATLLLSTQGLNQAQIDLVLSNEKVTATEIAEASVLDNVAKKKSILTAEQQKQLISSNAITSEKLAEISATLGLETAENGSLVSKKALNAEMVKQQLQSIGIVGSTQTQIMSMLGLTTAETSAATASNILSGAMAKLSLAMSTNPIGTLITVIGVAIASVYGLTKAFDALTDSSEEIDERVDSLISKYNDLKTTADNNASTIESLADEYESLSKGVNDLGENISLTSDEYDRYNEIVNQIADIFPTLITGYTDEGTAILSLKGNVEQLRDAYKEAQQEAYNLLVATGKDSDGNDIMESYKNLSELDWWDSSIGAEDVTTTVKRDITKQILDLMSNMDTAVEEYDKLAQYIFDTYGDKGYNFLEEMGLPAIKDVFSDTSGITKEALIAGKATVQSYYQGFQSEIDTKLSNVKLMANAFLNTNDFYLDESTSSELKNALSVIVNSLDEELANSFNGEKEKVGAYVNNIVNGIKDSKDAQKALTELFILDTTDMSVNDIQSNVDSYISTIATAIGEDPVKLKVRLGFDDTDTQPLIENVKKKLKGTEFDDKVGELSLEDLKIAADLEVGDDTIKSWDDLIERIEKVKSETFNNKTDISTFGQAWKALDNPADDTLKNTKDELLKLAEAGQLSAQSLKGVAGAEEYFKQIGLSAQDASNKINALVTSSNQLSSMRSGITSITDALSIKMSEGIVSSDKLGNFDISLQGLDTWKNFEEVMGNTNSSMEECREVANRLATEYVNSANFLSHLTEKNKDYYVSQLTEMGVINALEVVNSKLANSENALAVAQSEVAKYCETSTEAKQKYANIDLASAEANDIQALYNEANASGIATNGLRQLLAAKYNANNLSVATAADCRALAELYSYSINTANALNALAKAKSGNYMPYEAIKGYEKLATKGMSDTKVDIDIGGGNYGGSGGGGGGGSTTEPTIFDWIEVKIQRIESKISRLRTTAEDAFKKLSVRSSAYNKAISANEQELKLQQQAYDAYMARANSIGLSEDYKKKVREGKIQIEDIADQNLKDLIDQYQQWWGKADATNDKIQELNKSVIELKNAKIQLKIDVKQDNIDKAQSIIEKYAQKISYDDAQGKLTKSAYYDKQNTQISKQISNYKAINKYILEQRKNVAKNSEEYKNLTKVYQDNNNTLQQLNQTMYENSLASANLVNDKAKRLSERYGDRNEFLSAKEANSSESYAKQNSLIKREIANINTIAQGYQNAYDNAVNRVNSKSKAILNTKGNKSTKSILSKIKKYVKSGKSIPDSLITSAVAIDTSLGRKCNAYNAALVARDTAKKTNDLYKETSQQDKESLFIDQMSNISSYYDNRIGRYQQRATEINSAQTLAETKGFIASNVYTKGFRSTKQQELDFLISKREQLIKKMSEGGIEEGTDAWYQQLSVIDDVTNQINDATNELADYNNKIRQVEMEQFNFTQDRLNRLKDEVKFIIDELSRKELTSDDLGGFTKEGRAVNSLHLDTRNVYLEQAKDYYAQIQKIEGELSKDPYNTNLIKEKEDLYDKYRECIKGAEDEKDAIIDLYKQGYDALQNHIKDLISEYTDLLDQEKSVYEYQQNIADKTKTLANLRKQLAAYANDDSEEARAKVQSLNVSLQEAEKDLKETQYDKYISDQKDMLNDFSDDLSDSIDNIIKSMRDNFDKVEEAIGRHASENAETISRTINDLGYDQEYFNNTGNSISESIRSIKDFTDKLVTVSNNWANGNIPNGDSTLDAINDSKITPPINSATGGSSSNSNNASNKAAEEAKTKELARKQALEKMTIEAKLMAFMKQYGAKPHKSSYQALNTALKNKYGKVLTVANMDKLAKTLGVEIDGNYGKSGSLYKKLKSLSISGFKVGSSHIPYDQLALLAEEGMELHYSKSSGVLKPVGQGDKVFTNEMSENLWKLAQIDPYKFISGLTPDMPKVSSNNVNSNVSINMGNIVLPDVTNPTQFANALKDVVKNNSSVQRQLKELTIGSLNNGNSFNIRKY